MPNSINTNIAAYYAQANINLAATSAASSVARLSSGNRIVQASDDVASLSTGTSLQTTVSALKTAQSNVSQGTSLLQVADGALAQIQNILQQQKAISLQAGSGSLTNTDRGFLNQQFQALSQQVDSLAVGTTFNGVQLINGSLSKAATVANTSTNATAGSLTLNLVDNISLGENVLINGVAMYAVASAATATGNQFNLGSTLAETLSNLADRLNTLADSSTYNATLGAAIYSADNQTLTATARAGGKLSNAFTLGGTASSTLVGTNFITTNASASVTLTTAGDTSVYSVGQRIIANPNTAAAVNGILAKDLRGVITAITATTIVFTAQSAATSGSTVTAANSLKLDVVNDVGESNVNAGTIGSNFNLFASNSSFTSATTQISAANGSQTAAIAFRNGDTLTATVNGVSSTLHTFGTSDTLVGLVNGINANSGTTGFSATLIRDNSNLYNVRIDYAGTAGNILINGGTNYFSTAVSTNLLTGNNLYTDAVGNAVIGASSGGSFTGQSIISTGYIDLTGVAGSVGITAVDSNDTVIGATATAPFVVGESITATINGQTQILHTFVAGDGLDDIVASINAHTSDTGVYAAILTDADAANAFNIRLFTTVPTPATDQVYVSAGLNSAVASSTLNVLTTTNGGLTQVTTASLDGGADNGIGQGNTAVTGSIGNSILNDLGTTKSNAQILFTANASANDYITVGGQRFIFTSNTTNAAPNEILIGDTIQETVNNAISTLNRYLADGHALGTTAYELNQLDITGTADRLIFTAKGLGTVKTLAGAAAAVSQNLTSGSLVGGTLSNGSTIYGVDVTGVTNSAFQGTISGFTAQYTGTANTIDLSVTVGDETYTAQDVNAVVSTDTRIRLYSENGGYFDIQLNGGEVLSFSNQAGADEIAERMDTAFNSLSFLQNRIVSSYNGTGSITANSTVIGSLVGTSVSAQLRSFDSLNLTEVNVLAPSGSNLDAEITFIIGGEEYTTASGIGSTLGANQSYKLVSAADPNQFITFTTGDEAIDISSSDNAAAVKTALEAAFGTSATAAALSFQIGASTSDTLQVSLGSAQTSDLFGGADLDVSTQASAAAASLVLDDALATVTSLRASVGALEARFGFAAAALQSSVTNQDAARSALLDTDIAAESTSYATQQVKLQAGISVLAQANQQLQALLKLIG